MSNPLNLNHYDISRLSKDIRPSTIPGLDGLQFVFDTYLNAKLTKQYIEHKGGICTPIFEHDDQPITFVCSNMSDQDLTAFNNEIKKIRKEMADQLHLAIDTTDGNTTKQ